MSFPKSHCLGCGVNMASKKPYERRVLCSVAGEQVRDSWKEVMLAKLAMCELDLDLDKMIGTEEEPGYMCRLCFEKYKKLSHLRNELLGKAGEALAQINTLPELPTRKRKSDSVALYPPSKRILSGNDQASPAVVVSSMFIHNYVQMFSCITGSGQLQTTEDLCSNSFP